MVRFYELDVCRGIAISMMILFHVLWDLLYFQFLSIDLYHGFWKLFQVATATLFLLIVGISAALSAKNLNFSQRLKKFSLRSAKILSLASVITLITYFFMRDNYIFFGILHLIGVSIFLSSFFIRFKYANLIFGIVLITLGNILNQLTFSFKWLVWLGFEYNGLTTVDYYPLILWFGVVLIGIFLGKTFYENDKRIFGWQQIPENRFFIIFSYLGRHSLVIYLIHQPILFGLTYFIHYIIT